jgi:ribose-phosphate pyrophosphokinase
MKSGALSRLIITDSIEAPKEVADCPKIEQVPISTLLAEAIRRIANEESVSSLFD